MKTFDLIRPSTLLRVAEDAIGGAAKRVARSTKLVVHAYSVEYNAQIIVRLQRRLNKEIALLSAMDADQRTELAATQREVIARVEELQAGKKTRAVEVPLSA